VTDDPEESEDSTAKQSESLTLHYRTGILNFQSIFSLSHLFLCVSFLLVLFLPQDVYIVFTLPRGLKALAEGT